MASRTKIPLNPPFAKGEAEKCRTKRWAIKFAHPAKMAGSTPPLTRGGWEGLKCGSGLLAAMRHITKSGNPLCDKSHVELTLAAGRSLPPTRLFKLEWNKINEPEKC